MYIFIFILFYLFEGGNDEVYCGEREIFLPLILAPKCLQQLGLAQAHAMSLELHLGLRHGWQGLSVVFLGAGLKTA